MREKTTPIHVGATPRARAASAPACVIVIYGGELGRRIELPLGEITIGRDEESAISVELHTISRHHARIFMRKRTHFVEDLGSTNGTFVNGAPVTDVVPLGFGDVIQVGQVRLRLERPRADRSRR
jgi:pSer/pThr/pTyr-binding forkhead associated (FHA) protein